MGEIIAGAVSMDPPDYLSDVARAEWERLVQRMDSSFDITILAGYCVAYGRWVAAEAVLNQYTPVVVRNGTIYQSPYLTIANRAYDQMMRARDVLGLTSEALATLEGKPAVLSLAAPILTRNDTDLAVAYIQHHIESAADAAVLLRDRTHREAEAFRGSIERMLEGLSLAADEFDNVAVESARLNDAVLLAEPEPEELLTPGDTSDTDEALAHEFPEEAVVELEIVAPEPEGVAEVSA